MNFISQSQFRAILGLHSGQLRSNGLLGLSGMRIDQILKVYHVCGKLFCTIILARPCHELRFGVIRARGFLWFGYIRLV